MHTFLICLACFVGFGFLYALTSGVYLLLIIFPSKNGEIIIDSKSWHFKLAYPFNKYDEDFINDLRRTGINKCPYFAKLFIMTWFGWPFLIIWESAKFIVYNVFGILAGFIFLPSLEAEIDQHWYDKELNLLAAKMVSIPLCQRKLCGVKCRPIYFLLPLAYLLCWYLEPKLTLGCTVIIGTCILAIAIVVGIILLLALSMRKAKKTENGILVTEWLKTKKQRFCPKVPVI